ncbi:MAG: cysteine desulfurase family protein [bacterium]
MKRIHADHAATTRPDPSVVEAMRPWLGERFGNPASVHARGERARDALESARDAVARLLGARSEEVVFTATGSESNDLALSGAMHASSRRRLVVSAIEHASVLATARALEAEGFALTVVPARRDGTVDLDALAASLADDVALVSVMAVNNETGVRQPVEAVGALAKGVGALFHVDAVQAPGRLTVRVDDGRADLVSVAAHKFHGPLGAAALFVRRRTRLEPRVRGGQHEHGLRAGTPNVPALVGMGVAAERAHAALAAGEPARVAALTDRLLADLLAHVPACTPNGDPALRAAGTFNLCFTGVDGEAVLHELDREGIEVSTGSACSHALAGPSHVLIAMGRTPDEAHASVRFSLGAGNDEDDVTRLAAVVPAVVARLRALGGTTMERSA